MAIERGQSVTVGSSVTPTNRIAATRTTTTTSRPPKATGAARAKPTREQIARRAYEIWMDGGCPHGCDLDHWLQAERELRG